MEFDPNKPIYLQICDAICEQILDGRLKAEDRIPSVREYGADIGVGVTGTMGMRIPQTRTHPFRERFILQSCSGTVKRRGR